MKSLFPWRYPYLLDVPRQREVLRPTVRVRIVGSFPSFIEDALVDSGSEHTLIAPFLAEDAGVDLEHPNYEASIGMGGAVHDVRFADVTLRLQSPGDDDDDYFEWQAEIGVPDVWRIPFPVLLGQHGFFDRFTITMHRSAALTVVEDWGAFDERFGVDPVTSMPS